MYKKELQELEDFYNYEDKKQEGCFWIVLIIASVIIGLLTAMLFI